MTQQQRATEKIESWLITLRAPATHINKCDEQTVLIWCKRSDIDKTSKLPLNYTICKVEKHNGSTT